MMVGNIECYGIIYKITNKINGKCYIGQTIVGFNKRYLCSGKGIQRVYGYHKKYKKYGKAYNDYLFKSIEKYGEDAFEVIEIFDIAFSKEELDIKEKTYIKLFNCNVKNKGYNFTDGGGNGRPNKELRKRLSEKAKGRKATDETKRKLSEIHKGQVPWNIGKSWSDEHKEYLRTINSGSKNKNANLYEVVDLNGNSVIMCGNEIYNHCSIGILNISQQSFKKYISPIGKVDLDYIKNMIGNRRNNHTDIMIEKLIKFNGWIINKL